MMPLIAVTEAVFSSIKIWVLRVKPMLPIELNDVSADSNVS